MTSTEMIGDYIDVLVNQKVIKIGRSANMIWIWFEKNDGVKSTIWCLHIQSTFRILNLKREEIIVGSSDIYHPSKRMENADDFDWEQQGNNLFDEKSKNWLEKNIGISVKKILINLWGDLRIIFSNNDILEVYIDNSTKYAECWRLFEKEKKNKKHLVITGG